MCFLRLWSYGLTALYKSDYYYYYFVAFEARLHFIVTVCAWHAALKGCLAWLDLTYNCTIHVVLGGDREARLPSLSAAILRRPRRERLSIRNLRHARRSRSSQSRWLENLARCTAADPANKEFVNRRRFLAVSPYLYTLLWAPHPLPDYIIASRLLHTDLRRLVPDRVQFKLCMTVRRCMQDKASRSVFEGILHITLRHWRSTASSLSQPSPSFCATSSRNFWPSRAFAVAGPTAWNSLPDDLPNPSCCDSYFGRLLKSISFSFN